MSVVKIKASPKQLSKLRKGHPVRIRPPMEGEGFNLIVDPSRFDTISKSFGRGNGVEIALLPEEISANQKLSMEPTMEGRGIFGDRFDKMLEKKGLKKGAYAIGDALKPAVKAGLLGGLGAAATGLAGLETVASGGLGAGAIPLIYGTAGSLGALGLDYIDNPKKYQSNKSNAGGPKAPKISTLAGHAAEQQLHKQLNDTLGTEYGTLAKANLANAISAKESAYLNKDSVSGRMNPITGNASRDANFIGNGLRKREVGSIMGKGVFIPNPPALQSQPFGTNFQFQHTLPPSYQRFSKGSGLYA
jgi:hypothetical protein